MQVNNDGAGWGFIILIILIALFTTIHVNMKNEPQTPTEPQITTEVTHVNEQRQPEELNHGTSNLHRMYPNWFSHHPRFRYHTS